MIKTRTKTRRLTPENAPRMADAVQYVFFNEGCPKLHVAEHVGPNGSRRFGYQTVDRAIKAGLINARWVGNRYELNVTPRGLAFVEEYL
jgi:hypothetical protein